MTAVDEILRRVPTLFLSVRLFPDTVLGSGLVRIVEVLGGRGYKVDTFPRDSTDHTRPVGGVSPEGDFTDFRSGKVPVRYPNPFFYFMPPTLHFHPCTFVR